MKISARVMTPWEPHVAQKMRVVLFIVAKGLSSSQARVSWGCGVGFMLTFGSVKCK